MNFKEALTYIFNKRKSDGEIADPFLLYCRLTDLCCKSFEDKKKAELFYAVDKRLRIFETLLSDVKKGEKELFSSYVIVADLLSEQRFRGLIECAAVLCDPSRAAPKNPQANGGKPPQAKPKIQTNGNKLPRAKPKHTAFPCATQDRVANSKPNGKKKPTAQVAVQPAPAVRKRKRRTTLNTGVGGSDPSVLIGILVVAGVLTLIGLMVLFACVCSWPWTVWQWILGTIGASIFFGIVVVVLVLLNMDAIVDIHAVGTIIFGAVSTINVILGIALQGDYKILFGCLSVWLLVLGFLLALSNFVEGKLPWAIAQSAALTVTFAFMVAGLVLF